MKAVEESRRGVAWAFLEVALAGLLIAWRCTAPTWHPVYFDIPFYLGLFWIFLTLCPNPRAREAVAVGLMLLLLAVYLKGIMPHMLLAFDLLPP